MKPDADAVLTEIKAAFPAQRVVRFEPMVNSVQDDEPLLTAEAFADKDDWTKLDGTWLDAAPEGWATALNFLSDEAVCFYIPAYIAADLRSELKRVDPVYHLINGFDTSTRSSPFVLESLTLGQTTGNDDGPFLQQSRRPRSFTIWNGGSRKTMTALPLSHLRRLPPSGVIARARCATAFDHPVTCLVRLPLHSGLGAAVRRQLWACRSSLERPQWGGGFNRSNAADAPVRVALLPRWGGKKTGSFRSAVADC